MTIAVRGLTMRLLGLATAAVLAGHGLPAMAQSVPQGGGCGPSCAWTRSFGAGVGQPSQPTEGRDMRLFGYAAPHADGGATLIGEAIGDDGRRLWLTGVDAAGETVWETSAPGRLCQTASDDAGRSFVVTQEPDGDRFAITAYAADGSTRWSLPLAGEPSAVAALPGGDAAVVRGDGPDIEVARIAGSDGFVFDRPPAIDSRRTIPVPRVADAHPSAVAALPDGGLILAGFSLDRDGGGFVLRIDRDGSVLWDTRFDEVGRPTHRPCGTGGSAAMVRTLPDGRFAVLFLHNRHQGMDGLVAVLDADGTEVWRYEPALDDTDRFTFSMATAIGAAGDGGLLVAGVTSRPRGEFGHWIVRLRPDGTVDWRQDITQPAPGPGPGNLELSLSAVTAMPDGGALALATSGARLFRMQAWAFRLGPDGIGAGGRPAVHPPTPTHGPDDLLGSWVGTSSLGEVAQIRFEPDGQLVVLTGGREMLGSYTANFRREPGAIDFTIDRTDHVGIFEILPDGSARMAFDERERPTSFEAGGWEVVTLVRPAAPTDQSLDQAGSREAVMHMLALVPDTPEGRAGRPLVGYADFEAIVAAAYARTMPDIDFAAVSFETMAPALIRVSAGPSEYVQYLGLTEREMPELLGLTVADVRRGLAFGTPPQKGLLLGLTPGIDFGPAIAGALDARGLARRDIAGTTVWHRLDDGRMDLQTRNPADPFFGQLGQAARIALVDGVLAGSPFWSVAEAIVAAAGDGRSLGDDPVLRTAVEAVTDADRFEGRLLQLMLIDPADVMVADDTGVLLEALQQGRLDQLDTLIPDSRSLVMPPYLLAALADRFSGDRDEAVVALVYPDQATAETAAAALGPRLRAFQPQRGAEAWSDLWSSSDTTLAAHVYAAEGGMAVAVVTIGAPAVFPTDERSGGLRPVGGRVFRLLSGSYYSRDLRPLAVIE